MVVCDYFTTWTEVYAIPDHTALTGGDKLISTLGCPNQIHTDQRREIESILFTKCTLSSKWDKTTRITP